MRSDVAGKVSAADDLITTIEDYSKLGIYAMDNAVLFEKPEVKVKENYYRGIGWGLVETVVNPLTAALYPADKTARLNVLHAWWPGGLVIGGLLGVGMSSAGLGWQAKLGAVLIPAVAVILLCIGLKFPPTERAAAGVVSEFTCGLAVFSITQPVKFSPN